MNQRKPGDFWTGLPPFLAVLVPFLRKYSTQLLVILETKSELFIPILKAGNLPVPEA